MKTKLTVTIDEDLVPAAKKKARARGLSLSQLIENSLRDLDSEPGEPFSRRWGGRFVPADRNDELYRALAKKHL